MPLILPNNNLPRSHVIMPDSHTYPGDNLRRYEAFGNYCVEHLPEVIVDLGDHADMGSLSSYDVGKKDFVFQNVEADIEALHLSEEAMYAPINAWNRRLTGMKKKKYTPLVIKLNGNHEYRLAKLLEYEPRWASKTINMNSFNTRQDMAEVVVPYMDFIRIDGVHYSHAWASGVMGRPVPGAKALLAKKGVSATMGHSHVLDTASLTRPDGTSIRGLIAGCFLDPDYKGFGGPQVDQLYWSGILHKHDVLDGDYDLSEISIQRLMKNYL
jgi:hypothetical protein